MTTPALLTGGLALGYVFAIAGSAGMIIFARRFPSSTRIQDLTLTNERFCCLNGYQVWVVSWSLIVLGGILQLVFSVAMASCQR